MSSTHQIVVEMFLKPSVSSLPHNISDILVRAQLSETCDLNNSPTTTGSFSCNSGNCTTCRYIDHRHNKYTFHSTGETYKIKSHLTCNTFSVI